jgi:16S rRNA G966 N2-methylase RsmD
VQSSDIIKFLKSPQSDQLIEKYWNVAPDEVVLREKGLKTEEKRILASLLIIYKKAQEKLPEYVIHHAALTEKSYEQASSHAVATFRASLIQVDELLNLSGGIGADDVALSRTCKQITSVDADLEVHELAIYNNALFKIESILRVHSLAEEFIKSCPQYDVIYVDPDRRSNKIRTLLLEDASPNIVEIQHQLLAIANEVYVKLSPLTDLTEIKNKLHNCHAIWVISVENEVKEVLVKLSHSVQNEAITSAVIIHNKEIYIVSSNEMQIGIAEKGQELFVEPAAALIKSGLADTYFEKNGFRKVGPHAAFYMGKTSEMKLPGRAFVIVKQMLYKPKLLNKYFIDANVTYGHFKKRDFPMDVAALKKKHKLKDGGDDYFFFFTDSNKLLQVVHAQKPPIKHSLF